MEKKNRFFFLLSLALTFCFTHANFYSQTNTHQENLKSQGALKSKPAKVKLAGKDIIQPFNFGDVLLLPGIMYNQFMETKDFYMNLSDDDMLHGLRLQAGDKNPPGKNIGGWYEEFEALTLPQWISTYCRLYAITGDKTCCEKAVYLTREWWKCFNRIGEKADNDKWVIALLDVYNYCGRKDALDKLSNYILNRSRDKNKPLNMPALYKSISLGDTINGIRAFGDNGSEWYTRAWPLYLVYMQTGNAEYKNIAGYWEYKDYWDEFAENPVRPFSKTPVTGLNSEWCHTYSHINSFNAAAEAYRVKGNEYYLNALKNVYDWIQTSEMFVTGGYGPFLEHLMPLDSIAESLTTRTDHFETQCDTWAALRLSQNLITLTGEAKYGNWIERLAYNAINATIPLTPETNVMYYSNYNLNGAMKLNKPAAATCCAGTRPLNVIQYFINTYYHDNDNIYINLFTPSVVNWKHGRNSSVKLTQITDFPYSDKTELTINNKQSENFGVGIRIPEWLAYPGMTAAVNGRKINGTIKNGWFIINRQWKNGDKISVTMPMDFTLSVLDKNEGRPTAIMYGPLVMAFTTPDSTLIKLTNEKKWWIVEDPDQFKNNAAAKFSSNQQWWSYEGMLQTNPDKDLLASIDLKNIKKLITPVDNKLGFALKSNSSVKLKPFMNYKEGELYYMYILDDK